MIAGLRVLFIGGDEADAAVVGERLSSTGALPKIQRVDLEGATAALAQAPWEVLLVDARLPGLSIAAFLASALNGDGGPPVVVALDEGASEKQMVGWLGDGAADFVTRPHFQGLLPRLLRVRRDRLLNQKRRESERRLRHSTTALLKLAKSRKFAGDEVNVALREILQASAHAANVALASVWTFDREQGVLRGLQQYDARRGEFTSGEELKFSDYPVYFRALEEQQQIVTPDAAADPRTSELKPTYLALKGVTGLLDTGVRISGVLRGILRLEHVGPVRRWTAEEEVFAQAVAELIAVAFEVVERERAEARAADSEDRFRELFQHSRDCILLYQVSGDSVRCEDLNPAMLELLKQPKEALLGKTTHEVMPKETADLMSALHEQVLATRRSVTDEHWLNVPPTGRLCFNTALVPFFDKQGRIHRIAAIARNVTDERRLEAQLAESSKLEALGQLAGNIAHDFNNLLVGVFGWATRLSQHTDPLAREGGEQIAQAAMRARELTRQVLTFGRRETPEKKPLQLSELVRELVNLLAPSVAKNTRVHVELQATGTEVLGDAGQLHQAVLNLCTNALQAMPEGGRLTVKVDSVELSEDFALAHPPLQQGPYVRLTIEDNGHGMSAQTMSRIFEPFFTTKRGGIGAGLGLSVVHGIVRSHRGTLVVSSTVSEGSTFELFLPALTPAAVEFESLAGHEESLMLVDDQLNVAQSSAILLKQLGYRTTVFTDPREALAAFRQSPESFDVVMTDLTMPQLSGAELASAVHTIRPGVAVILTSGRPLTPQERTTLGPYEVLEKPWRVEEAVRVLNRVLRRAQ